MSLIVALIDPFKRNRILFIYALINSRFPGGHDDRSTSPGNVTAPVSSAATCGEETEPSALLLFGV